MIEGLHISDFSDNCLKKLPTIKEDEKFRDEFKKCANETGIDTDRHGGQKQAAQLFCINEQQADFKGPDGTYHPDHSQEYISINDGKRMFSGNTIALGNLEIEGARAQKCSNNVLQKLSGNDGVVQEYTKPVKYISPEQRSASQKSQKIDPIFASLAGAGLLVATLALRSPVVRSRLLEAGQLVSDVVKSNLFTNRINHESGQNGIQLV